MLGLVDDAHAAAAELAHDPVLVGERGADQGIRFRLRWGHDRASGATLSSARANGLVALGKVDLARLSCEIAAVLMLVAFAVVCVGIGLVARPPRGRKPQVVAHRIRMRTIEKLPGDVFRDNAKHPYEEQPERVSPQVALDTVVAALRAAGLAPRPLGKGFELAGAKPEQYFRVRVKQRDRVEPKAFVIETNEGETAIDVAHALVPVFGPIAIDMGSAAWIVVDGTHAVAGCGAS